LPAHHWPAFRIPDFAALSQVPWRQTRQSSEHDDQTDVDFDGSAVSAVADAGRIIDCASGRLLHNRRLYRAVAHFLGRDLPLGRRATWIMTLFIRRAENRDALAIQAKLDELLRAEHRARSELTTLDQKEPEEIARHRARQRRSTSTG
jgi:hypothetical protein